MSTSDKTRAVMAEFIAMVMFVFVGCGTAVSSNTLATTQLIGQEGIQVQDNTFLTAVSLAFGIGISVLAYTIAPVSGGHINPAVTFAFVVIRKMSIVDALGYWIAQFLGAILGAAMLWGCTDSDRLSEESGFPTPFALGSNSLNPFVSGGSAFFIEAMGTFLLVWTVMMTAVSPKSIAANLAPIAIGWSVLLAHLVLIPFTGCGINPARSAGPHVVTALAGGNLDTRGIWVYYTAPFVGSLVAALMASFIFGVTSEEEGEEEKSKPEQADGDEASSKDAEA